MRFSNMGQRNMCTGQMIDLELDQQVESHLRPEHRVLYGTMTNFPHPNVHTVMPVSGNVANLDIHHLPDNHDNTLFYAPHNAFQRQFPARNHHLGATASNFYNPYMAPSGTGMLPLPITGGSPDQLPSSSNRITGVPTDDYRRDNNVMYGIGVPFKRKDAEGFPGSFQCFNGSAGSSSSVTPLNARSVESGVTLVGPTFLLPNQETHRGLGNISGATGPDSVLAHNSYHLIQANYHQGQAFQTASSPWLDRQFSCNGADGANITYVHGSTINSGCPEPGNIGSPGYQETPGNRSFSPFLPHPPMHQVNLNLHYPSQPIQGVRGQTINFRPQVAAPSHRISTDSAANTNLNPFQDRGDTALRYAGPIPPTGHRIYQPHRRAFVPEATVRHRDLRHLRVLPVDEVAMLEVSGYREVGNSIDHHRDLRLDVDHMSYEELLELGEQIGNVVTGLPEETIMSHLKTRTYISSTTPVNLEEAACGQETEFCVICQTDYEAQEKIGTLDCGHEYHVDCVKRWLLIKNTCPICKSSALSPGRKESCSEG